ncbi:MAG: DUF4430 domain-containing protein [Leptospiraceae bacterium]|nr:DUF4430 domain-containing protein [Leptospiraceae bacterium]
MKAKWIIAILIVASLHCSPGEQSQSASGENSIEITLEGPSNAPEANKAIKVEFEEGTVLDLLLKTSSQGLLKFKYSGVGEKAFVESLQGVGPAGDGESGKYWIYSINGKLSNLGVGSQTIRGGDRLKWCYLSFAERNNCADK